MKKYFLGLSAIVCAIAFSAFTKPFAMVEYKLILGNDPVVAGIVSDDSKWADDGTTYGRCDVLQNDVACTVSLNSTKSAYFHTSGSHDILNTFNFASTQTPKQDYIEITEPTGVGSDYIISSLQPKHWDPTANSGSGAYVNASLGSDLTFKNARD